MHKILKKISAVVQLVLLAPVKLPGKALNVVRYIALGLGILEAVVKKEVNPDEVGTGELSSEPRLDRDKQVNENDEEP